MAEKITVVKRDPPEIGDPCTVRGVKCVITRILPFGTIKVEALDGHIAYRVSGLEF